jgi:hypothetical protein
MKMKIFLVIGGIALAVVGSLWTLASSSDNREKAFTQTPESMDSSVETERFVAHELKLRESIQGAPSSDSVNAPQSTSDLIGGEGVFPNFGDREVLPGVLLRDMVGVDLSVEEVNDVAETLQRLQAELAWEVFRSHPEVRESFLDHSEALDLCEQGFLIIKANDPLNKGGAKYFVCPDSLIPHLTELRAGGLAAFHSPTYIEDASGKLRQVASESPRGQGNVSLTVRSDGSGIDVFNDDAEPVTWTRFNIPGVVNGSLYQD